MLFISANLQMMSFAGSEGGAAAVPETTTKKHRRFVSEPMGDKPVTDLAGIGPAIGGRLIEKGFDKAYVVLGQFLLLKKDRELFVAWLQETTAANRKYSNDCYNCLSDWCDEFL